MPSPLRTDISFYGLLDELVSMTMAMDFVERLASKPQGQGYILPYLGREKSCLGHSIVTLSFFDVHDVRYLSME